MGEKLRNTWLVIKAVFGLAFVIGVAVTTWIVMDKAISCVDTTVENIKKSNARSEARQEKERELKASVLSSVSISKFDWQISDKSPLKPTNVDEFLDKYNHVLKATFTVNNTSEYQIKDFNISCTVSARSGTYLHTITKTIYDIVDAKSKKNFKNMEIGSVHDQGGNVKCKVTDVVIVR